jgi:hypothetical protein
MFTANKTSDWLCAKSEDDQKKLVQESMRDMSKVRQDFKERKIEIERKHKLAMEENVRKAEVTEAKRVEKLATRTDKIIYYGLWQTPETVDGALQEIEKESEKLEALKAQLNFRRFVLQQSPPKTGFEDVYLFSKTTNGQRKVFSVQDLKQNVLKLVNHAYTIPTDKTLNPGTPILCGKTVKHKFVRNNKEETYTGKVISQVQHGLIYCMVIQFIII